MAALIKANVRNFWWECRLKQAFIDVLQVFDVVIVINLAHRTDRMREISSELKKIGLTVNEIQRLNASQPSDRGEFPSIGARGCFESHMNALQFALDIDAKSVLILEDDCDFRGSVESALASLKACDWDIFYGGYLTANGEVSSDVPLGTIPFDVGVVGAHCVAFRGDTVADLLIFLREIYGKKAGDPTGGAMHVDGAYTRYREARPTRLTYYANPMFAFQRSSRSDIAALKWFDKTPGLRGFVGLARKLIRRRSLRS